jgi:hypothetical protein
LNNSSRKKALRRPSWASVARAWMIGKPPVILPKSVSMAHSATMNRGCTLKRRETLSRISRCSMIRWRAVSARASLTTRVTY